MPLIKYTVTVNLHTYLLNGPVFCLLTCNFCSNTDNIVYSGSVSDTTTLKVNAVPDSKPPVLWSNGYADSASLSDDYKAPIVLLPQLHSTSNGAIPVSNMLPQEYETPVSALISSAQPSDSLTSNDRAHRADRAQSKRNESRHENQHVVNGSYAKLLHQYLLCRQTKQTDRDSLSQVKCRGSMQYRSLTSYNPSFHFHTASVVL